MSNVSIAPNIIPRLEFFVLDADYLPVPSLTHADVTSATYILKTAGVDSAPVTNTPTSSVASTAAKSALQFVTINSARGHYAIDCAVGASLFSADTSRIQVVMVDSGHVVHEVQHKVDIILMSASTMVIGVVGSGSTTTSIVTSAFSIPGINTAQFKRRNVFFLPDTTSTGLRSQAVNIESSSIATLPVLTVAALTMIPVSGDTFVVV